MWFTSQTELQRNTVFLWGVSILMAPNIGCGSSEQNPPAIEPAGAESTHEPNTSTFSSLDGAWRIVTETTSSGLVIVSENISAGTTLVFDAGQTAWIWSADTTSDGWKCRRCD